MTIFILLMVLEPRLNTLRALLNHHRCKPNKTRWHDMTWWMTERYEFKLKTSACSRAVQVGSRTPHRGIRINHMGHKFMKRKRRQTCLWLRSPFSFVFSFAAPKFNDLFLVWFLVLLCLVQHFLQHTRRGHKQERKMNTQCCNMTWKIDLI